MLLTALCVSEGTRLLQVRVWASGASDVCVQRAVDQYIILRLQRVRGTRAHTLMDMRTDLIAVPHAGLGFQFLRIPVGNQRNLGVFKRRGGQKEKEGTAIASRTG